MTKVLKFDPDPETGAERMLNHVVQSYNVRLTKDVPDNTIIFLKSSFC